MQASEDRYLRQLLQWTLPYLENERLYEDEYSRRRRGGTTRTSRQGTGTARPWNGTSNCVNSAETSGTPCVQRMSMIQRAARSTDDLQGNVSPAEVGIELGEEFAAHVEPQRPLLLRLLAPEGEVVLDAAQSSLGGVDRHAGEVEVGDLGQGNMLLGGAEIVPIEACSPVSQTRLRDVAAGAASNEVGTAIPLRDRLGQQLNCLRRGVGIVQLWRCPARAGEQGLPGRNKGITFAVVPGLRRLIVLVGGQDRLDLFERERLDGASSTLAMRAVLLVAACWHLVTRLLLVAGIRSEIVCSGHDVGRLLNKAGVMRGEDDDVLQPRLKRGYALSDEPDSTRNSVPDSGDSGPPGPVSARGFAT